MSFNDALTGKQIAADVDRRAVFFERAFRRQDERRALRRLGHEELAHDEKRYLVERVCGSTWIASVAAPD